MTEKLYQLFEDVLRGNTDPGKFLKFEFVNESIYSSKELELYRFVRSCVLYMNDPYIENELRPKLERYGEKYFVDYNENNDVNSNRFLFRAIAACVLFVIGSVLFLDIENSEKSINRELASNYFISELSISRSAKYDERIKTYLEANKAFTEGSFEKAAQLYHEVLKIQNQNQELVEWNLLLSFLALEDERYKGLLNQILQNQNHSMSEHALNLSKKLHGFNR